MGTETELTLAVPPALVRELGNAAWLRHLRHPGARLSQPSIAF